MIILSQFSHLFDYIQTITKANPMVAGAVSLYGLGVVTFLFRHIPSKIITFFKHQFTTSLEFTSDNVGYNLYTFDNFMKWFSANKWSKYSRTLSLNASDNESNVIGMGDGTHFFMYKGRMFWVSRSQMANQGLRQVTYKLVITCVGRSRKLILDLIDEFRYIPDESKTGIYNFSYGGWSRAADIPKRSLKSVVIQKDIKDELIKTIDEFKESRSWYEEKGLAYKKTILIHGVPGTGKTSIIKALASHYNMSIAQLNITQVDDNGFNAAITNVPKGAFLVIEDFDSAKSTKSRSGVKHGNNGNNTAQTEDSNNKVTIDIESRLSLTGILNALEGIVSLEDKIIFLTTNTINDIDPAIIRKGRIDLVVNIDMMERAEIEEYTKLMFPDEYNNNEEDEENKFVIPEDVKPILGCDIQDLYFRNKDSIANFINSLPKYNKSNYRGIHGNKN